MIKGLQWPQTGVHCHVVHSMNHFTTGCILWWSLQLPHGVHTVVKFTVATLGAYCGEVYSCHTGCRLWWSLQLPHWVDTVVKFTVATLGAYCGEVYNCHTWCRLWWSLQLPHWVHTVVKFTVATLGALPHTHLVHTRCSGEVYSCHTGCILWCSMQLPHWVHTVVQYAVATRCILRWCLKWTILKGKTSFAAFAPNIVYFNWIHFLCQYKYIHFGT